MKTQNLQKQRDLSIDRYRGLAIFLMVIVNDIATVNGVPWWLKHAQDIGFTLADIVAPMFIFAIGLTYQVSFEKKLKKNKKDAYFDTARRYLAFIGIGAVLSAGEGKVWGVLEAIGVAGLLAMAVIRLGPVARLLVGGGMLAVYQIVLDTYALDQVLGNSHGGLIGSVSWGAMLILCTALAQFWHSNQKKFFIALGIVSAAAAGSACFIPVSKNRVSLSYVLICVAACSLLYILAKILSNRLQKKTDILCFWGENAITMYLLHLVLMGIMRTVTGFGDVALSVGMVRVALLVGILTAVAILMHRKNIRIAV
ncbi:MAG: heparan-alpha-glucosaminide N-acetyltransferase domain-containing protein [Oscillospiraceae bacterium]|nr:heparan-alpha-glucosaminide N-acetyltransferase domain-containing protein [Oscillospiraceae bacterium]